MNIRIKWLPLLLLLIVLVPLVGCGPSEADTERGAIISFTRQALQIEEQRDDLVGNNSLKNKYLFRSSAPGLQSKMLWLECPQALHTVKDSLVESYRLEIEAIQTDQAFLTINRLNVDSYPMIYGTANNPWLRAQKLRRDIYSHWSQILKDHGIDPGKEGFTVFTPTTTEQWNTISQAMFNSTGDRLLQEALEGVWYRGSTLTPLGKEKLQQIYKQYPMGAPSFDAWYKQKLRQTYEKSVDEAAKK